MEWQAIVTVLLVAGAGLYLAGQIRRRAEGGSGGRSLPECRRRLSPLPAPQNGR